MNLILLVRKKNRAPRGRADVEGQDMRYRPVFQAPIGSALAEHGA